MKCLSHTRMTMCILVITVLVVTPGFSPAQQQATSEMVALDPATRAAIVDSVNAALDDVHIFPNEPNRFLFEVVIDENGHAVRLITPEEAAEKSETKERTMAKNLACWWEINAKDAEPLVEFYSKVFAWDHTYDENSGIHYIDSGDGADGGIGGGIFTGKGRLPTHRCLYVKVEDVDAITEKVKKQGQPILQGPFELPSGTRLAFFQDPEGHMIGLIKPATKSTD